MSSTAADAPSRTAAQLMYPANLTDDEIKLVKRMPKKGRDGKTFGEEHYFLSNQASNPNASMTIMVGDHTLKPQPRYARVKWAPSQYQGKEDASWSMTLNLTGDDAEGLRRLARRAFDEMKRVGIFSSSVVPEVAHMVMSPIIKECDDGSVDLVVNLGDDVVFYEYIHSGKFAGKHKVITRQELLQDALVVAQVGLDRHRDKPKHRFTRYCRKVIVYKQGEPRGAKMVVGSDGTELEVVPADELEEEEAGEVATNAGAAAGSSSEPDNDEDDDDEFAQAAKRARKVDA